MQVVALFHGNWLLLSLNRCISPFPVKPLFAEAL